MTGCDVVVDGGVSPRMRDLMAGEVARVAGGTARRTDGLTSDALIVNDSR